MKAKIVDDLRKAMASPEAFGMDFYIYYDDDEFDRLCRRIEGKVVDLVFASGDAFEKLDNNIWLPDNCWEAVDENSGGDSEGV